ncbi:DEAD/DEAH-box helicase, putative (macronuclear) [Tetrahymena thermophila SB210]|uniref:RNA helicase n=1 Tax=Tetrahymena thermophila (strain SB210) TaxID=312017 RepID=Q22YX8_TETTS|nr:DEAD/DEAH-box helicase, putative [Tetrahymena thermophila SB210]EAR90543.1 DEAD/DEAH-box helicase, putative [Tetrahymena thermophila SB210]|eukprot:XP_001010788.1 DEAD/DEAH-box helicase, putative [Tetrahymena thermophila SB210]
MRTFEFKKKQFGNNQANSQEQQKQQWQEIQKQKKQRKEEDILVGERGGFQGFDQWDFKELPIVQHKQEILYCVENYSCVVVIAETGSGKTTKIPQYLVEAGYAINGKKIGVSQPRRIAAISIANRVAQEMGCIIGQEVGYSVRFDDNCDEELTQIKYMTDGMLINQILNDPLLSEYSVLMIDDIHERSINTDILLGLLKKIRRKNPQLKLVISSATIDAESISTFFQERVTDPKTNQVIANLTSQILYIEGRQFPVDIYYLKETTRNYVVKAVQVTLEIIRAPDKKGDILIFLTGQEEIEAFIEIIQKNFIGDAERQNLKILPLYSGLPLEDQMEVFKPSESYVRKIIVSTNIAESSITISGVVYVIDTLFHKINYYDFKRGFENLLVVPISKAAAKQRAGRAGRVQRGECYRLCTKDQFVQLYDNSTPEILRCDLSTFILQLKTLGVGDVTNFELLQQPNENAYAKALEQLFALKVIDKYCNLTQEIGHKICDFNLETKLGVLLLNSFKDDFGCSQQMLVLCSMLSLQGQVFYNGFDPATILKQKKKLGAKEGDHITLINIFLAFNHLKSSQARQGFCSDHKLNIKSLNMAVKIHDQLCKQVKRMGLKVNNSEDDIEGILRALVTAFFMNVAQLQPDGSYRNLRNKEILYLHPTSILNINFPQWVIYSEVVFSTKYYMREVSEVDPKWLLELASHYFEDQRLKQAEQKHGKEIIAQNEYEKNKQKIEEEKQKDPVMGRFNIFKRKRPTNVIGRDDDKEKEGQEKLQKKLKINLPPSKPQNTNLLSFQQDDEEEEEYNIEESDEDNNIKENE